MQSLKLAPGEKVIKQCQYLHAHGKKYDRTDSITITNKRLIEQSREEFKAVESFTTNEIPISDIDSLESFYTYGKKRIHPLILIISVVLFVVSIALFIAETTVGGIICLLISMLFIALAVLLRKKQYIFTVSANRISYQYTADHMALGGYSVNKANYAQETKNLKTSQKSRLLGNIIVFVALLLVCIFAVVIATTGDIESEFLMPVILAIFSLLILALALRKSAKILSRHGRNQKKKSIKPIQKLKIEVNGEAIAALIDELGALIYDLQNVEKNDLIENMQLKNILTENVKEEI